MNIFEILYREKILSNKNWVQPSSKIAMKKWHPLYGWATEARMDSGYEFKQFLADVYHCLGGLAKLNGMQQLIHHYYLRTGADAPTTAARIRIFLGEPL